jgi:LPXTG-motif cell wall-anchored protein
LADNQILIDSCGTGITSNQEGWDAVYIGSLIYLEGIDLAAKTVAAGAYAAIVNGEDVIIPPSPVEGITTSIDFSTDDGKQTMTGGGCGGSETYTFPNTFDIDSSIGFGGWAATPNGVAKYQYSIDGAHFYDISEATITERPDLAGANIGYVEGHSTAGFVVTIPVTAFNDGENNLTIRLIDTQDKYFDIIKATVNADNPGGAQIPDQDSGNQNSGNTGDNNQDTGDIGNTGTDDALAFVLVALMAIVSMAAVVLKRRKEY